MFPIHLDLGFKVFYYYEGFYFIVSILIASVLVAYRLKKSALDAEVFLGNFPWILLGAILGARIFHFLFWDMKSLLADPLDFIRFWEGGLSITGGLAGGVIVAFICFRREKADFWHYFGVVLPGMVPDHRVPSEAWIWSVQQGFTNPAALATVPLHPTQMYEALGDLILAVMVVFLLRGIAKRGGPWSQVFWFHLGGYSVLRFILEFLHGDRDVTVCLGMTAIQIALLVFGTLSGILYMRASPEAILQNRTKG